MEGIGDDGKEVPVICSSSDLVGKVIDHSCFLDDEDIESWFRGAVVQLLWKTGFLYGIMIFQMKHLCSHCIKILKQGMLGC